MIRRGPLNFREWSEVREICCLTGGVASLEGEERRRRWGFFADFWVGPYQRLLPDWTWVVEDDHGSVQGYLTGCPRTAEFEARKRLEFNPWLWGRVALGPLGPYGSWASQPEMKTAFLRGVGVEQSPAQRFPREVHERLLREFPAHLHMNFRPEVQRGGWGRKIVASFEEVLAGAGIHVFCGERPVGFYQKVGFKVLHQVLIKPDLPVFVMVK